MTDKTASDLAFAKLLVKFIDAGVEGHTPKKGETYFRPSRRPAEKVAISRQRLVAAIERTGD